MVLTFHVPIFDIFLEDKKGIGDVVCIFKLINLHTKIHENNSHNNVSLDYCFMLWFML